MVLTRLLIVLMIIQLTSCTIFNTKISNENIDKIYLPADLYIFLQGIDNYRTLGWKRVLAEFSQVDNIFIEPKKLDIDAKHFLFISIRQEKPSWRIPFGVILLGCCIVEHIIIDFEYYQLKPVKNNPIKYQYNDTADNSSQWSDIMQKALNRFIEQLHKESISIL